MKNLIKILIAALLLFSCSKKQHVENDVNTSDQILSEVTQTLKSSDPFEQALLGYYFLIDSLTRDSIFYDYLITDGFLSDTSIIPLTNLLTSYNNYSQSNVYSKQLLTLINNDSNLFDGGYQYYPCIYLSNFDSLNFNYKPILAFGLDLENIDDSISDIIYGRYYNAYNNLIEIEVNELNGLTSEIPVIIITVNIDETILNSNSGDNEIVMNQSDWDSDFKTTYYPFIDEYSIESLFDRSDRAEYKEVHTNFYLYDEEIEVDDELIDKIHKNHLGRTLTKDKQLDRDEEPNGMWFLTFEYDFFAIKKPVPVYHYDVGFNVKMTKKQEWYQKGFYFIPQEPGNFVNLVYQEGHCKIVTND